MMVSRATIVLIVYFIQGTLGHAVPQSPIVGIAGGQTVDIEDVPYMAYVQVGGSFCGGSIIHKQFVLTAAHCILKEHRSTDYVRVGSSYRNEGGQKISIAKYISHEKYKKNSTYKHNYDVGLVKLSKLLNFGRAVAPINLFDLNFEIYSGMKANVSGWGRTGPRVKTYELHQVAVTIYSNCKKRCHNYEWREIKKTEKTICAYDIGAQACKGDSGGPLVVGGLQIGIMSGGKPIEECGYSTNIYVKVSAHLQWIYHQIIYNV